MLFSHELVANYLLALQTKRFAILTGISGTGKTRIAKAVAQHFGPVRARERVPKIPDGCRRCKGEDLPTSKLSKIVLACRDKRRNLSIETGKEPPAAAHMIWVRYPGWAYPASAPTWQTGKYPVLLLQRGTIREWFQSTFKVGDTILASSAPG